MKGKRIQISTPFLNVYQIDSCLNPSFPGRATTTSISMVWLLDFELTLEAIFELI
jgi:hypothetical protein